MSSTHMKRLSIMKILMKFKICTDVHDETTLLQDELLAVVEQKCGDCRLHQLMIMIIILFNGKALNQFCVFARAPSKDADTEL